jgi:hypothetical protein
MLSVKLKIKRLLSNTGWLEITRKLIRAVSYPWRNCIHFISEALYRTPSVSVKFQQYISPPSKTIQSAIETLRSDGIVVIENYMQDEQLQDLKIDFESFVKSVEKLPLGPMKMTPGGSLHPQTQYPEQGYDIEYNMTFSYNPFKYSKRFLGVALDEYILEIIKGYIGKNFMLQQAAALRYHPHEKRDFGSWQWHHDSWGRKVNVMLLLTDVTQNDQYMSYMKRSHKIYHSYKNTVINDRFTEEDVKKLCGQSVLNCTGKAGTLIIFDANGFHRGNRSLGRARDSLSNQYTAGRYLWPFDIPAVFTDSLSKDQMEFLMKNPNVNLVL